MNHQTEPLIDTCLATIEDCVVRSRRRMALESLASECLEIGRKAGMSEAVGLCDYWKSGHESRLRTWPNNTIIKCEIQDIEELKQYIEKWRDNPKDKP